MINENPQPATSDMFNGGAAQSSPTVAPPPTWQPTGMPVTPAAFDAPEAVAARQEIQTKISDKEFYKSLVAERQRGVTGPASQAWAELHKRGYPAQTAVTSQVDVDSQANSRNAEQLNSYIANLKSQWPVTPEMEKEIRGGVIRMEDYQRAREEKDRLVNDREFRRKLLDGDRAARETWGRVTAALSLRPVKA